MKYAHILRAVSETPWAVRPHVLETIRDLLAFRASGGVLTNEEIQARIGAGPPRREAQVFGSVAVLPLWGVIAPKADMFTEMSGGTSLAAFAQSFRAAMADEQVSSIVIDIDSPGGTVDMVPEMGAEILAARGRKSVVAVANTVAASAAYWIGSQASEFVVTPSGEVGSIGVWAAHDDLSKAMDKAGIKTTLISAGKYKTEGNPFEALSEEARDYIQSQVDTFYGMFVDAVAAGRETTVSAVRSGFGQGRMVTAEDARAGGMVDRVATRDQVLAELIASARPAQPSQAATAYLPVVTTTDGTFSTTVTFPASSETVPNPEPSHEDDTQDAIGLGFAARRIAIHRRRLRQPAA